VAFGFTHLAIGRETYAAVVSRRLRELDEQVPQPPGDPVAAAPAADAVPVNSPSVVLQLQRPDDLAPPAKVVQEAFDLPSRRGAELARTTRLSLLTLLALHAALLTGATWLDQGRDVPLLVLLGTPLLLAFGMVATEDAWPASKRVGHTFWPFSNKAIADGAAAKQGEPTAPRRVLRYLYAVHVLVLPWVFLSGVDHESRLLWWTPTRGLMLAAFALLLAGHWMLHRWWRLRVLRRMPPPAPRRLVMLRVFGSHALPDLRAMLSPWYRVGPIDFPDGFDTVGDNEEVQQAAMRGRLDKALVQTAEQVRERLESAPMEPGRNLLYTSAPFQCANHVWRQAVLGMLMRADAVVMDLSSFTDRNEGSAQELGFLMNHVPLDRVTLLVNDSTDMSLVRQKLQQVADAAPPESPNRTGRPPVWRLLDVGGLTVRLPGESIEDWQRRGDQRLDPEVLCMHLYGTALQPRDARDSAAVSDDCLQRLAWAGSQTRALALIAWLGLFVWLARSGAV
jgi:hypothetical protein